MTEANIELETTSQINDKSQILMDKKQTATKFCFCCKLESWHMTMTIWGTFISIFMIITLIATKCIYFLIIFYTIIQFLLRILVSILGYKAFKLLNDYQESNKNVFYFIPCYGFLNFLLNIGCDISLCIFYNLLIIVPDPEIPKTAFIPFNTIFSIFFIVNCFGVYSYFKNIKNTFGIQWNNFLF